MTSKEHSKRYLFLLGIEKSLNILFREYPVVVDAVFSGMQCAHAPLRLGHTHTEPQKLLDSTPIFILQIFLTFSLQENLYHSYTKIFSSSSPKILWPAGRRSLDSGA